mgnify:CR=1 FL=1
MLSWAAPSDRNSLTIGPDGPILLHDVHFVNQMAHFNRERIPERNVHAKGGGAFGTFECTEDVSQFTKAALFQKGCSAEQGENLALVDGQADVLQRLEPAGIGLRQTLYGNDRLHARLRRRQRGSRRPTRALDVSARRHAASHLPARSDRDRKSVV